MPSSTARADFDRGDYRWVAEVLHHVVFADPDNAAARELQADTLEQIGYQCEAGTWRNWFLAGAKELRDGILDLPATRSTSADTIRVMPVPMFLDYLGVRLNGPQAEGVELTLNLTVTDSDPVERYAVRVHDCVLDHEDGALADDADASIEVARPSLERVMAGEATLEELVADGDAALSGDAGALTRLSGLLDDFEFWFPIVTP